MFNPVFIDLARRSVPKCLQIEIIVNLLIQINVYFTC